DEQQPSSACKPLFLADRRLGAEQGPPSRPPALERPLLAAALGAEQNPEVVDGVCRHETAAKKIPQGVLDCLERKARARDQLCEEASPATREQLGDRATRLDKVLRPIVKGLGARGGEQGSELGAPEKGQGRRATRLERPGGHGFHLGTTAWADDSRLPQAQ